MLYLVSVSPYIQDLVGNPIREAIAWTFNTTKEKTPPSVVSTNPAASQNDVTINASVKVIFSEEMDVSSLQTSMVVHDSLENPVIGNTTAAEDGMAVSFNPLFSYGYGETYRVTVLETVRDLAGNMMVNDYVFTFTVQLEQIPPRVVEIYPRDGDQFKNLTTKVSVKFSEPMNSLSLAGTVIIQDPAFEEVPTTPMYNADDYTLVVIPDQDLEYQTLYTVVVKNQAKDLAGNHLESKLTITFTTEKLPQAGPVIKTRSPPDEEFSWYEGIEVDFKVTADDPNGDILVYAWEINGEPQEGETFSEFTFYPEPGSEGMYKVEVQVLDGINAPVRHFWKVNVVRTTPEENGNTGPSSFNWFYLAIILILVIIGAVIAFGYIQLMDRKREILARTRRRLRPLSFKKAKPIDKPPTYEEMYLRPDGVYGKKSPEFKPVAAPVGGTVKGRAGTAATTYGTIMGEAPQLIEAKEIKVETAKVGPYTTAAPELKKTHPPGAMICTKCGRKAIEAAHGRLWCDTCGFVE
jgi:methionine-rich copper-binding protein CopC